MLVWTTGIIKGFSKEMKPILDLELSALGGNRMRKCTWVRICMDSKTISLSEVKSFLLTYDSTYMWNLENKTNE